MKALDMKIGIPSGEGKSWWHTIGTVFVDDDCDVFGQNNKPATFVLPFPKTNGIIVERKQKEDTK